MQKNRLGKSVFGIVMSILIIFLGCISFSRPDCLDINPYHRVTDAQMISEHANWKLDCQLPQRHFENVMESMRQVAIVRWRNDETMQFFLLCAGILLGLLFFQVWAFYYRFERTSGTSSLWYQIRYIHHVDGKKKHFL